MVRRRSRPAAGCCGQSPTRRAVVHDERQDELHSLPASLTSPRRGATGTSRRRTSRALPTSPRSPAGRLAPSATGARHRRPGSARASPAPAATSRRRAEAAGGSARRTGSPHRPATRILRRRATPSPRRPTPLPDKPGTPAAARRAARPGCGAGVSTEGCRRQCRSHPLVRHPETVRRRQRAGHRRRGRPDAALAVPAPSGEAAGPPRARLPGFRAGRRRGHARAPRRPVTGVGRQPARRARRSRRGGSNAPAGPASAPDAACAPPWHAHNELATRRPGNRAQVRAQPRSRRPAACRRTGCCDRGWAVARPRMR